MFMAYSFCILFYFLLLATIEKARKAAENDSYTSTDDQCLGKGQRKRIPNRFIHSHVDESEEEDDDEKSYMSTSTKKPKVYSKKKVNVSIHEEQFDDSFIENDHSIEKTLPVWPVWPVEKQNCRNNANIVNSVTNYNQNDSEFLFLTFKS